MDAIRSLRHHSTEPCHEYRFFSNDNYSCIRVGRKGKRKKERKGTISFWFKLTDKLNTKIEMLNKASAKAPFTVLSLPTRTPLPLSARRREGTL